MSHIYQLVPADPVRQRAEIKDIARHVYETIAYDAWGDEAETVDDDDYVSVMRDQVRFEIEERPKVEREWLLAYWDELEYNDKFKLLLEVR